MGLKPGCEARMLTRGLLLVLFVLIEVDSTPWMELNRDVSVDNFGGQVLGVQPMVTLWTSRDSVDDFGRPTPTQIAYDSVVNRVPVDAQLFDAATNADASSEWGGTTRVTASCGVALFTDLLVNKAGSYRISFSAVYLGSVPTGNQSRVLRVMPGDAYRLDIITQPRGTRAGFPIQVQPVLEVRDRGGNRVVNGTGASAVVSLSVSGPVGGAQILNNERSFAASEGIVRFNRVECQRCLVPADHAFGLALSARASALRIIFSSPGIVEARSQAFDVSEWPPQSLSIRRNMQNSRAGLPLAAQPELVLIDTNGNIVSWQDRESTVRATIRERIGFPDTLTGRSEIALVDGIVRFTDLSIRYRADQYILDFVPITTLPGIASVSSVPFDVAAGAPHHLGTSATFGKPAINGSSPAGAVPGFALTTQPVIVVRDVEDNWVGTADFAVTAELIHNGEPFPDAAFLASQRIESTCPPPLIPVRNICGVARFTDLRIDRALPGYTMRFTVAGLPAFTSSPTFTVSAGGSHKLAVLQEPLGFLSGTPFRVQPAVAVQDRGGNIIESGGARFSVGVQLLSAATRLPVPANLTQDAAPTLQPDGSILFSRLAIQLPVAGVFLRFTASPELPVPNVDTHKFTVASDPVTLAVVTQPAQAAPGSPLGVMPVVRVEDYGGVTSGWSLGTALQITASICIPESEMYNTTTWSCVDPIERPVGGFQLCFPDPEDPKKDTLRGVAMEPAVEGVAEFRSLQVDKQGRFKLRFSVGGLQFADSDPFEVRLGAAAKLGILVDLEPVHSKPGFPLLVQPAVVVQDVGGNRVIYDYTTEVTATLLVPEGQDGQLVLLPGVFRSISASGGISYFQGLRIDKAGRGYQMRFSSQSPPLTEALSRFFDVVDGPPAVLAVLVPPFGCRANSGGGPGAGYNCTVQPRVGVQDLGGNNVEGLTAVVSAAVLYSNGSRVLARRNLSVTMVDGIATWNDFAVDTPGVGYLLRFESAGLDPAVVQDLSVAATSASLLVDWLPEVIEPGYPMPTQPRVSVLDARGAVLQYDDGQTQVSVQISPAVPLGGEQTLPVSGGVAAFSDLRVDQRGICYRITFTAPGLASAVSRPFDVFLGFEKRITVTRQPGGVVPGAAMQVQPSIAVTDLGDNILTTDSETRVTASILNQPQQALLGGSGKVATVSAGLATYTNLRIDSSSTCFQIAFTSLGRESAYSDPFAVFPLSPSQLAFVAGFVPAGPAPGAPLAVQPVVSAVDLFGNTFIEAEGFVSVELLFGGQPADCATEKRCLHPSSTTSVAFTREGAAKGYAVFTDLRIDKTNEAGPANYSLLFSFGSLLPLESPRDLVVYTAETAQGLAVTVQPGIFVSGVPFGRKPVVGVIDAGGNVLTSSFPTQVDVILITRGTANLAGSTSAITNNGQATFTNLFVNGTGSGFVLRFQSFATGLGTTDSDKFDVPLPASTLNITRQPNGTSPGSPLAKQPQLIALDPLDRLVTALHGGNYSLPMNISVELTGVADKGLLQGTTTAVYADGKATFSDLRLDRVTGPSGYLLLFSFKDLHVTSQPVHVKNSQASRLVVLTQPLGADPGYALSQQPVVEIQDRFGNRVLDADFVVTATLLHNGMPAPNTSPLGGMTAVVSSLGVASFSSAALSLVSAGSDFALNFSAEGLEHATSEAFTVPIGAPFALAFIDRPSVFSLDEAIAPQPSIRVLDKGLNHAPINGSLVFASLHTTAGCPAPGHVGGDPLQCCCGQEAAESLKLAQPFCLPDELRMNVTDFCFNIVSNTMGKSGSFYVETINEYLSWALLSDFNVSKTQLFFPLSVNSSNGNLVIACRAYTSAFANETVNVSDPFTFIVYAGMQAQLRQSLTPLTKSSLNFTNGTAFSLTGGTCSPLYTLAVPTFSGVAQFRGLKVTTLSTDMKLRFTLQGATNLTLETTPFDVTSRATKLNLTITPSVSTTGGAALAPQPFIRLLDAQGRRVSNHTSTIVNATLIASDGLLFCTVTSPFRCPIPPAALAAGYSTSVCARTPEFCPQLLGTTSIEAELGRTQFTDLRITTCNTFLVQSEICVFGRYRILFTARPAGTAATLTFVTTPVITVSIGPEYIILINNPPVGGQRAGEVMPAAPDVLVNDKGGNRVLTSTIPVTAFLVYNNTDFPASAVMGKPTEAAIKGGATFTNLRITVARFNLTMRFTSPGLIPALYDGQFAVLQGAGSSLKLIREPSGAFGGSPFLTQPILHVTDTLNNVVSIGPGVTVIASLVPESNEYGAILLSKGSSVVTVAGIATFTNLTIDRFGFCYQLRFDAAGLTGALSSSFKVSTGPPATMTVFKQPTDPRPGYTFDRLPEVGITDLGGNIVKVGGVPDRIEASYLPGNVSDAFLFGTLSVLTEGGVARWTDLMVKKQGEGFRLLFRRVAGGMADVPSAPFNVRPGDAQNLRVSREPAGAAPGALLTTQPEVEIADAGGNFVNAGVHMVTANLFQNGLPSPISLRGPACEDFECTGQCGAGTVCADPREACPTCACSNTSLGYDPVLSVRTVNGVARFTQLTIESRGVDYTIRFTSSTLLWAEASSRLSVLPGLAVRLRLATQPWGFLEGVPFQRQPSIALSDVGNNVASLDNGVVSVELVSGAGVQLVSVRGLEVITRRGVADFLGLRVDTAGNGYQLRFTSPACMAATGSVCRPAFSMPFNVTLRGVSLSLCSMPSDAFAASVFGVQPVVQVHDEVGRVVNSDSGVSIVTASLLPTANPKNSTLSGSRSVACCSGVCVFTDLAIDRAHPSYVLIFDSSPFANVSSSPFSVWGPARLEVQRHPAGAIERRPFVVQPVVRILGDLDAAREVAIDASWNFTVKASIVPDTGYFNARLLGTTSVSAPVGVAEFTDLAVDGAGSAFVLEFTSSYLYSNMSEPFDVDYEMRPNAQCTRGEVCRSILGVSNIPKG